MATPTLQAEGATATGVTSGVPSVAIPTHQADDILVVCAVIWAPNTTTPDAAQIPTPSGWTLLGAQVGQPAGSPRDGWCAWFWKRAAGAGTTVTLTRGSGWDTGTDTCYSARAYVIRGCIKTGDPWDATANAGPYTTANQAFPAVTVSGTERLVIIFGNVTDNLSFSMASSGWTTGTEDSDSGGTDSSYQTALKSNVSSSTSADACTVTQPAAGAYGFLGVSFKPPAAHAIVGALTVASIIAATLLDFSRHAALIGSVSVASAPSATMGYTAAAHQYVIAGALTVFANPSAVLVHESHHALIGAVPVVMTPLASVSFTQHHIIVGDITAFLTPAADLSYLVGTNAHSVIGNVAFATIISASLAFHGVLSAPPYLRFDQNWRLGLSVTGEPYWPYWIVGGTNWRTCRDESGYPLGTWFRA